MKATVIGSVTLIAAAMALAEARAQPAPAGPAPSAAPAAASKAGVHLLKLTNAGKGAIDAIYVARAGTQDASDDLLGKQVAGVGKTVTLKVNDPKGDCLFDIQFLMTDGATITRKGVDLCQTTNVTLTP